MKVLLFNGPPGSGKDTIARAVLPFLPGRVDTFKLAQPIRNWVCSTLGVPDEWIEGHKADPFPTFGGTVREAMIWYSESVMKPRFGPTVFADILVRNLAASTAAYATVTDCGFQTEVDVVRREHPTAHLFQMHRDGCSFKGDSRYWVWGLPELTDRIDNNDRTVIQVGERVAQRALGHPFR